MWPKKKKKKLGDRDPEMTARTELPDEEESKNSHHDLFLEGTHP